MRRGMRLAVVLVLAAVAEIVALLFSLAAAEFGHGTYRTFKAFFPYAFALTHFTDSLTPPLVALCLLQYPLYGVVLDASMGSSKGDSAVSRLFGGLLVVAIMHGCAVMLAFAFANPGTVP